MKFNRIKYNISFLATLPNKLGHCIFLKKVIIAYLFLFSFYSLSAQNDIGKIISISFENKPLVQVLYDLSTTHDLKFFFDPDDMPYYLLNGNFKEQPIFAIIKKLLDGTQLIALPYRYKGLCLINKTKANREYIEALINNWENGTFDYPFEKEIKTLDYNFGKKENKKENAELNILLRDEKNGESVIGAVIRNDDFTISEISDAAGKIFMEVPTGNYVFTITYLGYQTTILNIGLFDDAYITVPMTFQSFTFKEIEVVANSLEQKLNDSEVGKEIIEIKKIETIPQVLGEVDIIKSLEVLPGVTSVGELSAGFNVRGGNIDESLVLLNDGIIFNPTHIVGFISAFNADVLDKATLYKAYVDPAYGNRGSAVLELKSDASDVKDWQGKGGAWHFHD